MKTAREEVQEYILRKMNAHYEQNKKLALLPNAEKIDIAELAIKFQAEIEIGLEAHPRESELLPSDRMTIATAIIKWVEDNIGMTPQPPVRLN